MRTKLPPATGMVWWLKPAVNGNRRLLIRAETEGGPVEETYEVEEVVGGYRLHALADYVDGFKCYRIDTTFGKAWTCDCPDARNRPERLTCCKHVRGLRAGLRALPF